MAISSSHFHGVVPGAVVERIYWAVPSSYGVGEEYESRIEALEAAIEKVKLLRHESAFVPETVVVDERWSFKNPVIRGGGSWGSSAGLDTVVNRETYETLAQAEGLLELAKRFAPNEWGQVTG
jgi:hypothetical protein